MPTISDLIPWIEHKVCKVTDNACLSLARSLQHADYLDADYDSIAHTFKLTVYWSQARTDDEVWTDSHESGKGQTIEVGVLMNEKPSEPEELKFSGWLTIPGENKEPCKCSFSKSLRKRAQLMSFSCYHVRDSCEASHSVVGRTGLIPSDFPTADGYASRYAAFFPGQRNGPASTVVCLAYLLDPA